MKNQALFSSKDKSKKSKCRLLQLLFSALRVNSVSAHVRPKMHHEYSALFYQQY